MSNSFLFLCETFEKIEQESSRLKIQEILSDYISKNSKDDYSTIFYLCNSMIYPNWDSRELNVGESQIIKIISDFSMKNVKLIQAEFQKEGDLGTIAMKYKLNTLFKSNKKYTINEIFTIFREIADIQGKDSNQTRARVITKVLTVLTAIEKKFFIRLLECKLKIGLALQTVLISFGMVMFSDKEITIEIDSEEISDENQDKSSKKRKKGIELTDQNPIKIFKAAYDRCSDIEVLFNVFNVKGIVGLRDLSIVSLKPFRPMLCMPLSSFCVPFDSFICEIKYDGERIQIHKTADQVVMYSRNGENSTAKYSELVDIAMQQKHNFVIDGEVVAFDVENCQILPFQVLSTRKKKKFEDNKVEICLFIFDILSLNGNSLLNCDLRERREIMEEHIQTGPNVQFSQILSRFDGDKSFVQDAIFKTTENQVKEKPEEAKCDKIQEITNENLKITKQDPLYVVECAFNESNNLAQEGILIKSLESAYIPNKRSNEWLKLKKDYLSMADTLDLIVMGAFYGKGKRTGVFGGFLMGCLRNEKYESICRLGTGFDEKTLAVLKEKLKQTTKRPKEYISSVEPDIWIEPDHIFEVNAAEISSSTLYTTEISLRFPRYIRIRDDKK
ncbi:DNA ligase I, ATP-dependent (dnl1), partial [Pseudoloma neurophilia]